MTECPCVEVHVSSRSDFQKEHGPPSFQKEHDGPPSFQKELALHRSKKSMALHRVVLTFLATQSLASPLATVDEHPALEPTAYRHSHAPRSPQTLSTKVYGAPTDLSIGHRQGSIAAWPAGCARLFAAAVAATCRYAF